MAKTLIMNFTQPILSLQYEQKGIEQSMGEMGKIDYNNEKKYLELNELRKKSL